MLFFENLKIYGQTSWEWFAFMNNIKPTFSKETSSTTSTNIKPMSIEHQLI